jgi:GNAT superfamily N-acetyltransferase
MNPQIRRATAADAVLLTHIMHESSAYHGQYAPMLHGYKVTPEQVERDLMYLVEVDGEVAGFYSLIGVPNGTPELDLMFVRDAYQGRRLGALLIEHLREVARQHGVKEVKIISNPPAEVFYLRVGAVRTGTEPPRGRVTWERPILSLPIEQG